MKTLSYFAPREMSNVGEKVATQKVPLAGSELQPIGKRTGDRPGDEVIEVSMLLRPKARASAPPAGAPRVSREEFAAKHGADEKVVEQVQQFAQACNLTVSEGVRAAPHSEIEGRRGRFD